LYVRATLAALLTAAAVSCGLVDPNITEFDLTLPSKQFTVDAEQWADVDAATLTSVPCQANPDMCITAAEQGCPDGECAAVCDTSTSTCDLTLYVALYQGVDLYNEKPELQTIEGQPLLDVTIDAISFEVSANTMNIETPEMVVYAAPSTVMTPDPERARRIGTVPPVPAGMTRSLTPIAFDPAGRANLATFMADFKTPFNIIVGASLLVENGTPVPAGAMTVRVVVQAHAGL
jgi:hypothetical protein